MLVLSLVLLGASLCDRQFASLALAPDNVPLVAMLYLLGFFTWLATAQAVKNDRPRQNGDPPAEGDGCRTDFLIRPNAGRIRKSVLRSVVPVWPDLVYSELICAVTVMAVLLAWSLLVPAPLEGPANPAVTPNPARAPWYFLGVQELLFHADARLAGLILPCLVILALAALPYLDRNPAGNGCYTIRRRRLVFQSGFWLWILLMVVGVFLRGPNWGFFGPFQVRVP
jgi:quinol-cytochrome oxidoreductase complex cytochrome b subunit